MLIEVSFFFFFAAVKTTIIYPATANHIKKYTTQEVFIFTESPEDYRTKTLPHLETEKFSLDVSVIFIGIACLVWGL